MKTTISTEILKDHIQIILTKGDLTLSINCLISDLAYHYATNGDILSLKDIRQIVKDNLKPFKILKTYNFSNLIEEWSSGDFSFKKEDNLIVCQSLINPQDILYLTSKELKDDKRWNLSQKDFDKLKSKKNLEKKKALKISKNLDITLDLGLESFL